MLNGTQAHAATPLRRGAQNSLRSNFNERKIKRHLNYIDNKIEEYEKTLDLEDNFDLKKGRS